MRISTLLLTLFLSTTAFSQNLLRTSWSFVAGTVGQESVRAIETDAQGNIYVGGYFSGLIDFDPGPGTFNLQSNGSNADAFLLKLDPNGKFLWAKSFRGSNNDFEDVYYLHIDDSSNVYATGQYGRNIQFVQGGTYYPGTTGSTNWMNRNYIVKFDSAGVFKWANVWYGTTANDLVKTFGIVTDDFGNVYSAGTFKGAVDFDPDSSSVLLENGIELDIFIMKLNATGELLNIKTLNEPGDQTANTIDIDNSNRLYIAGGFSETVDFDPGPDSTKLTYQGNGGNFNYDSYILKLNANLDFIWVKTFGGIENDQIDHLEIYDDNLYTAGRFVHAANFNPDLNNSAIITAYNNSDGFIQKLDTAGIFQWVNAVRAWNAVSVYDLSVFQNDRIVFVGGASGNVITLDTSNYPNNYNVAGKGGVDAFISAYSSNGGFESGTVFGSSNTEWARAVSFAQNGDLLVGGFYKGTMDIDPTAGVNQVTCSGADDMFLLRLSACATTDSVVATACDTFVTYAGKTITTSGWHGDTLTTTQGCDSVTYYDVTINSSNFGLQIWQQDTMIVSQVQNPSGKQFQWIDCTTNQPIAGATGSTFSPTENGVYALVATDGNCSDTSGCLTTYGIGIAENSLPQVSVFPNPTSGLLHINTAHKIMHIAIFDLTGRKIISIQKADSQIDISSLQSGVYLAEITTEQGSVVTRVVKK